MAMTQNAAVRNSGTCALAALVFAWATVVDASDTYRWVDEAGDVHYTDAPPPESARRPAAETERESADADARAQEKAAAERQARRDHVLQQSYSSVADIERTRDRRLDGVDGEIGLAKHRVEQARRRVERYQRLLADLPEDNEHRAEMERQQTEARERLQRRERELEQARAKRARMEARFERDIKRFRELTAERE
jgi:chromosome segregation ATPase